MPITVRLAFLGLQFARLLLHPVQLADQIKPAMGLAALLVLALRLESLAVYIVLNII